MENLLSISINIAFISIIISFLFAFVRMILGPTLADRVVAVDLIAFLTIAFIGVYTVQTGAESFLDIAITLALVAFLSTLAFARFIMMNEQDKKEDNS